MTKTMRQSTLETLGLGQVIDIFHNGRLPAEAGDLVDQVFGPAGKRGALVISGAEGIVGAGKSMQLGSRLAPFGIQIVALDFPNAPNGISRQYPGLVAAFGSETADKIMGNIVRMSYDGKTLPPDLQAYRPAFLLEAIPEILEVKRAHYKLFRESYPDITIRSVTSGFPARELGVGVAHPAFPHEINKLWEVVEETPSAVTQLLWALGLIPVPVSDDWAFVLDVLFCGITLAGTRYHQASNMPFWKIDKYIRQLLGPNPFRAHDAIGASGANFLTWSCLHHLGQNYGELFTPSTKMTEQKDSGSNWYPLNHLRPMVDWKLAAGDETFRNWILGPMIQMTSLMLHEKRAHLTLMDAMAELCAQFNPGMVATIRNLGAKEAKRIVTSYHALHPQAADAAWYPGVFEEMDSPEWQQLHVNAEHDGKVGVITISRESYNADVNAELGRAIDWLKQETIDRVILTGDFHLSTQMVGADTSEFFPALSDTAAGERIATSWSETARRLNDEFEISIGFVNGKRCLGGFLELLTHCHYLVATDRAQLGMPEVTLPVVPGMEGCHWPFRKAAAADWPKLQRMLLSGTPVRATDAVGWLVDYAGPLNDSLKMVWQLASEGAGAFPRRTVQTGTLGDLPLEVGGLPDPGDPAIETARKAIMDNILTSCRASLADALVIQAKASADFMTTKACQRGRIGAEYSKIVIS
jgi:enoyl-CoA hydratase/carnithine racemase/3-hydroxyacyl-CoA dehydrogenase